MLDTFLFRDGCVANPAVRTSCPFVPRSADQHVRLGDMVARYRHCADRTAYCGVRLEDMTRDEILAFAAWCSKEAAEHGAFGPLVRDVIPAPA